MDQDQTQERRAYLVRCVADGLHGPDDAGPCGTEGLVALQVAERVVEHLDRLGFIVLRRQPQALPEA